MLIDGPKIVEGSYVRNLTVASGDTAAEAALNASLGELFYNTDFDVLKVFDGTDWLEPGSVALDTHIGDYTLHLTASQNALLDGLNPTLTAAELNFVDGVTSPLQAQIDAVADPITGSLATHIDDLSVHLTPAQDTLLDDFEANLTTSVTELNYVTGVTSSIQTQLNSIASVNVTQNNRLTTLETVTVPNVQTNLSNHEGDSTLHLTPSQDTLLDGITVLAADVNKLTGASALVGTIASLLNGLEANKVNRAGDTMTGNLAMGTNRITGLGSPTGPSDAATKLYVDSLVDGMRWFDPARVASTTNIDLGVGGLLTVDGVTLSVSDRVLVKDQSNPAENGVYLAASGAWSRTPDASTAEYLTTSAIFVREGTLQETSTWIQNNTIVNLGVDPVNFIPSSGPVVNSAGPGIILGVGGDVSVRQGAGISFNIDELIVNVHGTGGLMTTVDNSSSSLVAGAQLALTNTAVTPGSYGSATAAPQLAVDAKGRITSATSVTVTPAFGSITGTPTTLAGYGITDAQPLDTDLSAIAALATNGILVRTGSGTATTRSLAISGVGLSISNADGVSGNITITSNGTSANTASTLIARDGSGNFSAGTITASLTGSATQLGGIVAASHMAFRGSVTVANINTATSNGFYDEDNSGYSKAVLVFNPGGSAGTMQYRHTYGGGPGEMFEFRNRTDNITWSAWKAVLHSANYNSYAPTLTGGGASGTWGINITGNSATVGGFTPSATAAVGNRVVVANASGYIFNNYFNSTDNSVSTGVSAVMVKAGDNYYRSGTAASIAEFLASTALQTTSLSVANGGAGQIRIQTGGGSNTGYVEFFRPGGVTREGYIGYTTVGGSMNYVSETAGAHSFSGSITASGDITAFSDLRLKTNIETISNAIEKVEAVRGVTFERIDSGERGTGVIAQEIQAVLPEAVKTNENGTLSVAYGNLVGLLIEAVKDLNTEVKALKAELAKVTK